MAGIGLVAMLLYGAAPADAIARAAGDFYTYDFETVISGIDVTGDITFRFQGTDTVTSGGGEIPVNVMDISGEISGGIAMLTLVTATVEGTSYETQDGAAIVEEDLTFFANLTIGTGQFSFVRTVQEEFASTYSPPLLSQFDPSSTSPGDRWFETVMVSATNTTWLNGEMWGSPVTVNTTVVYNISVGEALDTITMPAGTFDCLRIEVSNSTGDSLTYWWSTDVGNFVRIYTYPPGSSNPRETLELTDYSHESPVDIMLIVTVGATVLVVAVVILALVLIKMRRPPASQDYGERVLEPGPPPVAP